MSASGGEAVVPQTSAEVRVLPLAVIAPVEFADRDVMKCWSRIIPTSY